jgi:hypothetical protein
LFLSTVGNHESVWQGTDSLYQGRDSGGECGLAVDLVRYAALNLLWSCGLMGLFGALSIILYT